MKNKKIYLCLIASLLLCAIALNLSGCALPVKATDLMKDVTPNSVEPLTDLSGGRAELTDFAVRLFKAANAEGKNTLISPLSVLCALSMTANGAKGETREQMEDVLGMSVEELNIYIYSYMKSLASEGKNKLSLANSIWFTDDERFSVNEEFLQTNADYYGASAYKTPFDNSTLKDINNWVKQKTDGMIPEILDRIPAEAIMYLVNALAFDAEWQKVYEKHQVRDGEFTKEDGSKQDVEMMYGTEGRYLADGKAQGFIKHYKGGQYAFAALLPNEGISVEEYINSLDGEALAAMLANAEAATVETAIPKFKTEYGVEMSDILKAMGMTLAFDGANADFSGLGGSGAGNISIGSVLHKTYIEVGAQGTKAAAVTVVEMVGEAAVEIPDEIKKVYLDRPFVYMLIDCENNIPFFIGSVMEIGK